jgi:hypothetical protein
LTDGYYYYYYDDDDDDNNNNKGKSIPLQAYGAQRVLGG